MRGPARAFSVGVALVLILGACSGVSSPSPSAAAHSAAASIGPTPEPTPQSPSLSFTWPQGSDPVATRTLAGLDEQYINPGAVIEDGGQIHMFANVFTTWPGHVDVVHLVSSDAVSWTLANPDPVLTSDDVPFADPGADVSTGFVTPDGTWVLIIESVSSTNPWVIGRATASDPNGPWTVEPEPMLEPGPPGSFDAGGLHWPDVVATTGGYAMYYAGFDQPGGTGAIGMATSSDGVSWTRRSEPVLSAEAAWELGSLDRPRVAQTPTGLAMIYAGLQLTDRGLAWSDDGISWTRDGDTPVISQATFPITGSSWDAALVYRDDLLQYFLEIGGTGGDGTNVYRAVSPLPGS
jgi:predicted GH43/DUF377 family glycosyl hydrolase